MTSYRDRLGAGGRAREGSRELADRLRAAGVEDVPARGPSGKGPSPVYLPGDIRLRSSSALARDAAVFYGRGGREREAIERLFIEPLPFRRRLGMIVVLSLLARLVRDEPLDQATAVAEEIVRRRSERQR